MSHTLLFVLFGGLCILMSQTTRHEKQIRALQEEMKQAHPDTVYVITTVPVALPDTLHLKKR